MLKTLKPKKECALNSPNVTSVVTSGPAVCNSQPYNSQQNVNSSEVV